MDIIKIILNIFLKLFLVLFIFYFLILILSSFFLNYFLFFPPVAGYKDKDLNILKLSLPNGLQISGIYLNNPNAKYTILYSHGNGEDLGMVNQRLKDYLKAGFSIFSYDYPGYGTSEGHPNEKNTYQSIFAAYNYLTQDLAIPPSHIIAYGFSVGSGPTIELATKKPLAAVILQSPFLSVFRYITRIQIFPWDTYNNYKKISQIKVPILIYHGTNDRIIPIFHAKILWNKASNPKKFVEIPNADHNDFITLAGQNYWNTLHEFISSLQ